MCGDINPGIFINYILWLRLSIQFLSFFILFVFVFFNANGSTDTMYLYPTSRKRTAYLQRARVFCSYKK